MSRALLVLVLVAVACTKSPPASDVAPGLVPVAQFVTIADGGATARTISVVLDQQPAGNRSLLAVSATQIERHGTPERFAQPNVACPNQIVASCLITNCTSLRDVISYPYGTVSPVAVGQVHVQGASRSERFAADGGSRPKVAQATTPLFAAGEVVKVSVGSDVTPAFQRTLVVPRTVALVSPQVESAGSTITVNRETSFEVHWSPLPKGSPEMVAVSVSDNVRTATCRFDASVGVAQVPKEVMAQLAPGPGFLTVHTLWAHDEATDGWLVSVFARHVAVQRDGGTASFPTLDLE